MLERGSQIGVEFDKGARDAMSNCASLSGWTTASYVNYQVKLSNLRTVKHDP